ncbi:MAG: IS3 family transposase [Leptospiraceae bacterium]|nr:IS3 family transposase [Leptospiraceae bacterium]MCP5501327.1 IS3 family transposase [Leptospiraceae bacterium]
MKKKGKYSEEFKEQAVKRTLSGSFTIKEVAESLGINYHTLQSWRKEYLQKQESGMPLTDKQVKEHEELRNLRKENMKLKEENAIFKKVCSHALKRTVDRYTFMEASNETFPIMSMARILDVSKSGYYKYRNRCKDELSKYCPEIIEHLKNTWKKSKKTYGLIRLLDAVKKVDKSYGARRVRRMMELLAIKGKQEKKFKISTTDSKHNERIARDLVKRNFSPKEKNKIWVSDVTYIKQKESWLYLCVIIDLYSRKVVGWSLSEKNDSELITTTLDKAIRSRRPGRGLIFHTDRGSNYCSRKTRIKLIENKIIRSNSRKGNCWDNAVAESYFSTLKREMEVNVFYDLEDAKKEFFDYIEIFYNRQRTHSFLGYKTPTEYEEMAA